MIGVVGDLLEDIVVAVLSAPEAPGGSLSLNLGADTDVAVERRLGGSGAVVALTAAGLGMPVRFIGQVGDDDVGRRLVERLAGAGVDVAVRHGGTTGTVIVLLHPDGERSMLTDRGAARLLTGVDPGWTVGLDALHVPLYSMQGGPLAGTTVELARLVAGRGAPVSVDLSSTSLLRWLGDDVAGTLGSLAPAVVVANEAEAAVLVEESGLALASLAPVVVVKRGPAPAVVVTGGDRVEVPAVALGPVADSTGAGDAFAAGLLTALARGDGVIGAVAAGHRAAADLLAARGRPGREAATGAGGGRDVGRDPGPGEA